MQRLTGLLIGAVFGAVFVFVNSHPPLDPTIALVLRVAASAALGGVVLLWFTAVRRARTTGVEPVVAGGQAGGKMFGLGFAVIAVAEVVMLFGGIAVLRALDRPVETNVAWIALVVGLHFVALGPVWKNRTIMLPGLVLTVLGAVGLAMTFTSAVEWVPLVSGVLSGVTLLAGCTASSWSALSVRTGAA
ncbi:hypothetical protein Ppa06_62360 [Planomonospora parontospora subsp. parontospora]|uniref:Uncharacterized protein n=2 Tax=Planomonospora parontospora TaxID=58119 RepID=A0AA37BC48_9ACTN|nr:hypothetical protein [Planomonospora parontospora]GGK49195.1 hypothetical protein GCM10010126_06000 [Planomonospora parontospora]GII12438.1 hypothetical protein Ppa06_62360 [Planomonospora parontospora subsp. parontospora]